MVEWMKAENCVELIKQRVKDLRNARNEMQTELNCLVKETNRLEELMFLIERQIEKDGAVDVVPNKE